MTLNEANKLLHKCSNLTRYDVFREYYCMEWVVKIQEKEISESAMYINPSLARILANYEYSIQNSGGGYKGMRLHVFKLADELITINN